MGSGQSKQQQQQQSMMVESVPVANANANANTTTNYAKSNNNESNENKNEGGSTKKCPMQNADGSYSYSLKAFFGAGLKNPHFNKSVSPADVDETLETKVPISVSGGCPVVQKKEEPATSTGSPTSGCPVLVKNTKTQYNVYSQPMDPNNQMPAVANQLPSA
eukprot:CAMPEP_0198289040 /NCGR_PEP_ID=MMETSP1449-20131203/7374_1 /TAXON_ID=420275 /ORGANISM="Attheya septentrionalis, Strain CCMP2084" /LENGTH=161 /DNA_ID=CAMNT_0043987307 /DNA_START=61 /DNA_END=542 /DNA_ORIENTATION=-